MRQRRGTSTVLEDRDSGNAAPRHFRHALSAEGGRCSYVLRISGSNRGRPKPFARSERFGQRHPGLFTRSVKRPSPRTKPRGRKDIESGPILTQIKPEGGAGRRPSTSKGRRRASKADRSAQKRPKSTKNGRKLRAQHSTGQARCIARRAPITAVSPQSSARRAKSVRFGEKTFRNARVRGGSPRASLFRMIGAGSSRLFRHLGQTHIPVARCGIGSCRLTNPFRDLVR